ncbi:TonB-linked outer membrane protein, SusC/RagA family [Mucilaginibacter pineti]|uniref:TonB-linked outer membrane protein, SusC/RagA family n=2 Tax=Mucilaginibacter pineti TaxID=1391627 RepID=A0A1G6ZSM7_9SPHI|nr:TonB-linked outer membrane protein, SusC/RagA family [Mucilaginibacter pineti]
MKYKPILVKIMKITFLQLTLSLSLLASAFAKDVKGQSILDTKVSVSETNAALKTVIKKLEQKYHVNFVFSPALINDSQKVSASFTEKSLGTVLTQLFTPLNLAYEVSGDVIVISNVNANALPSVFTKPADLDMTQAPIKGRIVDDKGLPLAGITITIKGTQTGTVTDTEGKFSLNVAAGTVLVFTAVGFETQEIAAQTEPMSIVLLASNNNLAEIVVVGTTFKKGDLTGAVSNVDAKTLQERPVTNVNSALQGRVAGVFIGGGSKPSDDAVIRIRGINTINSGSTPIYVVDGLIMENNLGGFNSINMNDVASVSILKDASATALYGSRGANGVVVITTKKGKKKAGDGTINYDGWAGFSNIANMPSTMNAQQLFNLRVDAYANGYIKDNPTANRQDYIDNNLLKTNLAFSQQEFDTNNSGKSYDWLKAISQTGYQQNHALSFAGGTDKGTFYLSLGYAGTTGIIQHLNENKYTGRFNADYDVKKWLKIGTNTGFTRTDDGQTDDDVYNQAINANPLLNYNPYRAADTRYTPNYLTVYYRALGQNSNNSFNPFNALDITRNQNRNRLVTSNYISINPIKGLDIRSTYSVDYGQQSYFTFTPNNIQEAIRNYNGDARAKAERWNDLYWQWDNTATYTKTFNSKHRITALLGTSASKRTSNYTLAQGDRFASNDLSYFDLNGAAAQDKTTIGSNFYAYSIFSVIARFTYSYDDKYFVTATARDDGSSRFAPGHQYGIFPSASVKWDINKEDFMKQQKIFDQLSLRVGYGVVGNQDITNYAFQTLYGSKVNNNNALISNDGLRGNPDLTWERQKQANLGIDMAFLNSRLSVTADAFYINNDNLLLDRQLALTTGYSHQLQNIGRVNNKGVDLSLSGQVIKSSDWNWTLAGNISFAKNTVKQLYGTATEIYNISGSTIQREGNLFINQPLHGIYTLRSGGIAQESNRSQWDGLNYNGKTVGLGDLFALDVSGPNGVKDGIVNQYDLQLVGNEDPKYYGGFSTDLNYKGVSLNAVFVYSHGAKKISSYYEGLINSVGSSMASTDLLNRWTPTNTNTNIPRVIDNTSYNRYNPSDLDYAIQDGSYLRLSALTLGYDLPQKLLNSWHANRVRVYATGSNLFLITKYKGLDPETGDYGYPPVRTFVLGVNFGF